MAAAVVIGVAVLAVVVMVVMVMMVAVVAVVVPVIVLVVIQVDKEGFKHDEQRRQGIVERENGRVCTPFKY